MKRFVILSLALLFVMSVAVARQPQSGYRGFAEWANSLGSIDMWYPGNTESTLYTGISTSHGYQINPIFFAGAGIGVERCGKIDSWLVPVFVQGRADLKFGRFTPFGDLRLGYNLSQGGGVYFSPSIGYRFNWGRKMGINLGVGLTVQRYSYDIYNFDYVNPDPDGGYVTYEKIGKGHGTKAFFSFRIGFDF